ncbi:glycosyltransferase [Clostridium sp. HCP1S3_B4]|uniref:glycosyltransferase n=1 Tax=unclassified Clostridium TaxID=2614128 RepID=UPI003F8C4413
MNEKKFCFISCVNNNQYYEECLYYIERLNVPEGYEIEVLSVEDSKSMAGGYNEAMNVSDAKYKVYLHQDTFIINENFLYDILYTFENNSDIGMIGVIGSKVIPTSAIWYEANNKYGKVYESSSGNLRKFKLKDVKRRYEEAKIIDGLIMITQYDLPWRDDVFDGYHFYDASQSTEFIKKGYKVVVPNQDKPWVIHDCGMARISDYEKYRQKFINEYYKDIFPLVSILIPTYNRPEYFKLALESAINQTYKNIEIIVGDDSTNNETEKLIKDYLNKYDNIRYYHNKNNLGQFDNDLKLMDMSKGRYVNFLMDDDLFEKDKIEKMINVFIEDDKNEISLVSSNRKLIDDEGIFKINYILDETVRVMCDKILNGKEITEVMLSQNKNILGEPTTVLFDKTKMTEKFGYYNNRRFICNVDQATWFNLLRNSNCVILSEALSSFRIHSNQQLTFKENIIGGVKDYSYLIMNASSNNLFLDNEQYLIAIDNCLIYAKTVSLTCENDSVEEAVKSLTDLKKEISNRIPLLTVVVNCKDKNIDAINIFDKVKTNVYSNVEMIFIKNKNQKIDIKNSEYFSIYNYLEELNENENINRAMHDISGQYIMYIDDSNIDLINENSLDMMKFHTNNDIAIVIKGICLENNNVILGKDLLNYFVYNISKIINTKMLCIINKKYYINNIGTYFDKTFTYNINLATICSALRFGNAICLGNEKHNLISDSNLISMYLEGLALIKAIKMDKCLNNILDYQNSIKLIFKEINLIINKNKWDYLNDEIKKFKEQYEVNTKNIKFYDYGYNTLIRDGAEIICEEAISIGNNTLIKEDSTLMVPYYNFKGKPRIIIGDNCDIGKRIFISSVNKVEIEDEVIIASNVHIADHNHEYKEIGIPIRRQGVDSFKNEVKIGFGTWIGNNVVIIGNVKIGRGCTIGANSIVNSNIPDYCVAVGQPAKVIKYYDSEIGKWVNVSNEHKVKRNIENITNKKPIFTIGIPTYNRSFYLNKCLETIYKQVGNDNLIEILVVDNASTDATYNVVQKYKNKYSNFTYIKRKETINGNENISSIYKLGKGEFISCIGDDDYYSDGVIYKALNIILKNRNISTMFVLPNNCEFTSYIGQGIDDYIEKVSYMCTLISGIIIKKSLIDKVYKYKVDKFCFNQVIYQLESLKLNNKFAILFGHIFRNDSGAHKPSGYSLADVFIHKYLDTICKYKEFGLSDETYKREKKKLIDNMIIPWVYKIKKEHVGLLVDDLIDVYTKYYKNETYYKEKLSIIEKLLQE